MDRLTKLRTSEDGRKFISCIHRDTDECINNGNCKECQMLNSMISKLYFVENLLDEAESERESKK